jgi:hypothetical protein
MKVSAALALSALMNWAASTKRRVEGLVGLGVLVVEFLRGVQHVEGRRPAEHVVRAQHLVHVFVFQRLVVERRAGEVRC